MAGKDAHCFDTRVSRSANHGHLDLIVHCHLRDNSPLREDFESTQLS
jgi:hypothetical protein